MTTGFKNKYWESVYYLASCIFTGENTPQEIFHDIKDRVREKQMEKAIPPLSKDRVILANEL